jgi:carbon-monoxide dehydrogenase medium subunit
MRHVKPPAFAYFAPRTLEEALQLAAQHADDGKLLAGGQSLMPVLNFRLASPAALIDLNRVAGLAGITPTPAGGFAIRALTRHRAVERSLDVLRFCPLLFAAMPHIAHMQIRNRGTIGGSLSHADPAAELPAIAVACGAELVIASSLRGERVIPAESFFLGVFTTALESDEILTEIRLPAWPAGRRWGFQEVTRRHGDFALAGAAVWLDGGRHDGVPCAAARIVLFGVGNAPVRAIAAEQFLADGPTTDTRLREAGRLAAAAIEPPSDLHASAEYRRDVASVLVRRALEEALARGTGRSAA